MDCDSILPSTERMDEDLRAEEDRIPLNPPTGMDLDPCEEEDRRNKESSPPIGVAPAKEADVVMSGQLEERPAEEPGTRQLQNGSVTKAPDNGDGQLADRKWLVNHVSTE